MDLDEEELKATRKMNGADKEIEEGEYVRTYEGEIFKVQNYNDNKEIEYFQNEFNEYRDKNIITKHSKNIIDLIEVGDILEIEEDKKIYFLGINIVDMI